MAMATPKCRPVLSLLLLAVSSCLPHVVTSLSFDYNFSAPGVLTGADLKYMNDSAPVLDRIDLTNLSRSWSTGRVAHGQAVRLWDDATGKAASFTTNFTFAIKSLDVTTSQASTRNSLKYSSVLQGDGMAFFVGPYPPSMPTDATGGFLALFNNRGNPANTYFPPTVGVEFDTLRNVEWDPNDTISHLGLNVNDIRSRNYTALPDGSFNGAMSASVRYDAGTATLSATLRLDDMPELSSYTVSTNVDCRAAGLTQDAAVGFSAAIGDYVEQHQIFSWSFESTLTDEIITSKRKETGLVAGLVSTGIFIFVAVAASLGYLQYLKRKGMHAQDAPEDSDVPLDQDMDDVFEKGAGPRRFSYDELSRATRGFSDEEKLGEGGFGAVYRGYLQEQGLHVAIKRISKTSSQGRREYVAEVTIIGRLRHRNLVLLVGWCHKADELLLVYELMTNGSLDEHLYSSTNILTWPTRYKIILGTGSALLYLHQEWEQCVVHRDIKPSNIMLDASFNPKLGDFGLARLVDHSRGGYTTMLAGTKGYMDPECAVTSRAGAETDVYSFGIVLLEVACGRRPIAPLQEDENKVVLVQWIQKLYVGGTLLDAADTRLDGNFDAQEMERVLVVGLWCVHPDYGFRPSIRQAMSALHFEAPAPDLPPEMPVAMYAPPCRGHRSSYTSSNGSSSSGNRSSTSDRAEENRSSASAGTKSARRPIATPTNQTLGTRTTE
ncbi:L-type lectin-domain containing receptor kinase IX.1-like [Triticum urartu]|uniref:L-type lectin-domain containing receptor kinase IX.1-like n=1 Tax=Triticum urartu TaxID=4572 RepID=UPI002043D0F0|nr:L-type lectin-domain containing receptor kinase IX.1-like [Triticum urartu]